MLPTTLECPSELCYYRGSVKVFFVFDNTTLGLGQPASEPIVVPDCPVFPRILLQARDNGHKPLGPMWTYEPQENGGRGAWVYFDPKIHLIPLSKSKPTLPDVGSVDHSPVPDTDGSKVESSADAAPMSPVPPSPSKRPRKEKVQLPPGKVDE